MAFEKVTKTTYTFDHKVLNGLLKTVKTKQGRTRFYTESKRPEWSENFLKVVFPSPLELEGRVTFYGSSNMFRRTKEDGTRDLEPERSPQGGWDFHLDFHDLSWTPVTHIQHLFSYFFAHKPNDRDRMCVIKSQK